MPLLLLCAALLANEVPARPTAPSWQTIAPGVEHLHLEVGDAELLRFDLGRYRADVLVPGPERPLTAAAARARNHGVLAVNGGFFDGDGRSLGLRIAAGKTVVGKRPKVDWGMLLVRDGQASIVHSSEYVPDAEVQAAIQVGPRLLVAGHPTPLKAQSARRTAVALDKDGRALTVLVTRAPVDAGALAQALEQLGFESALLLDGGPSTQLSAAAGAFTLDVAGAYAVPDVLVVRERDRAGRSPRR
jgi:exopolysaccharide biosynthesis protein